MMSITGSVGMLRSHDRAPQAGRARTLTASGRRFRMSPHSSVVLRALATEQEGKTVVKSETIQKCIGALQFLAIDAVNESGSGHPGAPMGMAMLAYVLFNEVMKFNPKNPGLFNRDRFVLSNGHASMMQYGMLHLCGSDTFTMDQLKQLRQFGSATPGHPERQIADGIEVTTGPLGQGIANAVGLAVAEVHLAARFNKPDAPKVIDNYTYVTLGDGCMMEGISQEACSLAGHWGLGKLIALYDDNNITIDGKTDITFTEDTMKRFEALGWHVQHVADGNSDLDGIRNAISAAQQCTDRPSLIRVSTQIGYGSPNKVGTPGVHGSALGEGEATLTREKAGWGSELFSVPDEVYEAMRDVRVPSGAQYEEEFHTALEEYRKKYPDEAAELDRIRNGGLPEGWEDVLPKFEADDDDATRKHGHKVLQALATKIQAILGGSADLASSNKTLLECCDDFKRGQYHYRNLRFGVREHGMGAICNGIAAYAPGIIPFASTFTIFTDYMRAAMRLSALSNNRVLYITTHDSIGLGGDGPTHQPVEQLAGFRAMPNMPVLRPCGGNETAGAYAIALRRADGPTLLVLSRQSMAELPGCSAENVEKGAYVVDDCEGKPTHILIGTGSEVPLCVEAAQILRNEGVAARAVSMPCMELFDEQSDEYKESVLPKSAHKRVSVEAAAPFGWREYVGDHGISLGMRTFGASAPPDVNMKNFGFTAEEVVKAARAL